MNNSIQESTAWLMFRLTTECNQQAKCLCCSDLCLFNSLAWQSGLSNTRNLRAPSSWPSANSRCISPHEADGLITAKTIEATLYGGTFGGVVIENPPQSKDTVARP